MSPTSEPEAEDHRWAFGTGFTDPRAGIGLGAPAAEGVAERCLALGDDALIYSHRLQEWVTRAPELEEETALANIALDLLGQARLLLSRAGFVLGESEDELAFFREAEQFRNVRLVERADANFAELVGRLLVFATWRLALLDRLRAADDPALAAIASRGATELRYHRDYAAGWVVRLGDGTELSHGRMQAGLDAIWPFVDELFLPDALLSDTADLRAAFDTALDPVLSTATLQRPTAADQPADGVGGRDGVHTRQLDEILAEMQSVARAHPSGTW